ncbi:MULTISPECIES: hypothetical protein [unclassified Streptomyces]|uniref:hypothetical protein n=1 Tax=unclassified Streptomyces TaxID=2593676 RepID=UPI0028C38B31|nr:MULTISPECIES: hypothetical protein [unclassified Streptomyces]WNO70697.1 hypothetical protein RPQ07_03230 [Streptomyces sp. AM8-1-1]
METQAAGTRDTLSLLRIYLNDHLAGSTGGVELLRRSARSHRSSSIGRELARLAAEVAADREALLRLMAQLGVPPQRAKVALGWIGEKAGRLKFNGRVASRSPLSDVLELEVMRLGVEGKASCWRTLRALAESDDRLDAVLIDGLLDRAKEQAAALEALRTSVAADVLGGGRARK